MNKQSRLVRWAAGETRRLAETGFAPYQIYDPFGYRDARKSPDPFWHNNPNPLTSPDYSWFDSEEVGAVSFTREQVQSYIERVHTEVQAFNRVAFELEQNSRQMPYRPGYGDRVFSSFTQGTPGRRWTPEIANAWGLFYQWSPHEVVYGQPPVGWLDFRGLYGSTTWIYTPTGADFVVAAARLFHERLRAFWDKWTGLGGTPPMARPDPDASMPGSREAVARWEARARGSRVSGDENEVGFSPFQVQAHYDRVDSEVRALDTAISEYQAARIGDGQPGLEQEYLGRWEAFKWTDPFVLNVSGTIAGPYWGWWTFRAPWSGWVSNWAKLTKSEECIQHATGFETHLQALWDEFISLGLKPKGERPDPTKPVPSTTEDLKSAAKNIAGGIFVLGLLFGGGYLLNSIGGLRRART